MSITTQKIESSVLGNVVRFKNFTTSAKLQVGTKYAYSPETSRSLGERRRSDKSPLVFAYRDSSTREIVTLSSFDFHAFFFREESLEDYFVLYPDEVDTQICNEFSILNIKHQLADLSFTDKEVVDTVDDFKLRYPLYAHVGYAKYKKKLDDERKKNPDFRMESKDIEKCRKTSLKPNHLGNHYKQLSIDCKLIEVEESSLKAYLESLK